LTKGLDKGGHVGLLETKKKKLLHTSERTRQERADRGPPLMLDEKKP